MPRKTSPLIQVSTMAPFVRAVEEAGFSPAKLGAPVGITAEMLRDPRVLAPANSIYRFTELAAQELKEPNLCVKLGLNPAIARWPVVADTFDQSQVLVEFFARFLLESRKFTTSVDFQLELGNDVSWFRRDRGFTPRQRPAQIDAFSVGLFVTLFRKALGDAWKPSDMLFKICDPDAARVPDIGTCALVKGNARSLAISFPSDWLVRPIQRNQSKDPAPRTSKPLSEALIVAIRSNIRSNIADPGFGVPMLVEQMGFDRRTVQRYLRERGSGLADLIEQERREMACEFLGRGELGLEDIALSLGYTDLSNFSRAFRRWTGVPPSRWRDAAQ